MGYECTTDSASDFYGLGVRLGIYFAWVSGYINNVVLESQTASGLEANSIFLLTLFIVMLNSTLYDTLTQLDGLVLMHLCSGTVFGILSIWGYRTRHYRSQGPAAISGYGGHGSHLRLFLSLAVSIYGLWFWLHGVTDGLPTAVEADPTNPPECSTLHTFFFANIQASGGIRFYYILVCVGCVAWFGIMALASVLACWILAKRLPQMIGTSSVAGSASWIGKLPFATGLRPNELHFMHKVLRAFNLAWLLWSIITVEMTLNLNHVKGVLGGSNNTLASPGQLLPFLVGFCGILRTCYTWLHDRPRTKDLTVFRDADMGIDATAWARYNAPLMDRYLVGWLPWLSLLERFRPTPPALDEYQANSDFENVPVTAYKH